MRLRRRYDEDGDDPILRDGERLHVPLRMADSMQRDIGVVDTFGGTQGLQRPGWRLETGGSQCDQLLRDRAYHDREAAYADYHDELTCAWQNPRPTGARSVNHRSGDDKIDDHCAAIRQPLPQRRTDRESTKSQLSDLDDTEMRNDDIDEPANAFERRRGGTYQPGLRQQSADAATLVRDHQHRMATLYAARDRELQDEWRRGK